MTQTIEFWYAKKIAGAWYIEKTKGWKTLHGDYHCTGGTGRAVYVSGDCVGETRGKAIAKARNALVVEWRALKSDIDYLNVAECEPEHP